MVQLPLRAGASTFWTNTVEAREWTQFDTSSGNSTDFIICSTNGSISLFPEVLQIEIMVSLDKSAISLLEETIKSDTFCIISCKFLLIESGLFSDKNNIHLRP